MRKIAFIKVLAFIVCVVIKAIVFPFWLLGRLLVEMLKGIHFVCSIVLIVFLKLKECGEKGREKYQKSKERRKRKKAGKKRNKARRKKSLVKIKLQKIKGVIRNSLRIYVSKHNIIGKRYLKNLFLKCISFGQRVYRKLYAVRKKMYWLIQSLLNRGYWKLRTIGQKMYWFIQSGVSMVYWKIYQRVYWYIRSKYSSAYWKFFSWSRSVYNRMIAFEYVEIFFIFLRGYFEARDTKMTCVPIIAVKEYVKRYSKKTSFYVIEAGKTRTVCIPEYFEKGRMQLEKFESPDIYVAEINEASVIGGSNVLLANNYLLSDAAYYDKEHRIDIRYSAIKKVVDGIAMIEDTVLEDTYEKAICLVGAASFNYYHLVVEILSRLTFVDSYNEYKGYPIIVDEIVLNIPQFKTALMYINKYNHPIIKLKKGKKYHIKNLVVPSSNVWMPTNVYNRNTIRTGDFMISETVLKNIRDSVGVWEKSKPWRKIFISRKNAQAVRLSNEEAVRNTFAQNGFEIVFTEEMTFEQQVECFGQAACVIATSGAALTNTIFCQKGTIIGCIIPSNHRFYMYSTIAYLLGLEPIFLDAEITELAPYAAADTFILQDDYVKRYVNYINKRLRGHIYD